MFNLTQTIRTIPPFSEDDLWKIFLVLSSSKYGYIFQELFSAGSLCHCSAASRWLLSKSLSLRVITNDLWWGQVSSPSNSVFPCQLHFQQCLCPPTIRRCYNKLRSLSNKWLLSYPSPTTKKKMCSLKDQTVGGSSYLSKFSVTVTVDNLELLFLVWKDYLDGFGFRTAQNKGCCSRSKFIEVDKCEAGGVTGQLLHNEPIHQVRLPNHTYASATLFGCCLTY